jgi:FKBP-type peptidyl-prolyl cis-trans isomerase FkpA
MKRLFLALTSLMLAGCSLQTTGPVDNPTNPATETFDASLKIDLTKMTKTANGVYYIDVTPGTGTVLSGTPNISFTYSGYLKTGSRFDANVVAPPGIPLTQLIYGFQEGLQGMKVGGERVLVIPSALGYGPNAYAGIPANSTLVFDVKLDAIG